MLTRNENKEILSKSDKIIITTHHKPDGDALGSSLGLYHWLKSQNHDVHVIVSSDFPTFLDWLPGRDEVLIYPDQTVLCQSLIDEASLIFCLDYNALSRTNVMEDVLRASTAKKYMIDHHLDPEGFDDYRLWDPQAAATAQLIYTFIEGCVDEVSEITPEIATCLYAGIMTDTGSFRFRSTTEQVHEIISKLIRSGARNWEIHEQIYNSSTENRLKFLGHCLLNRLEVIHEYNTALFAVSKQDLEQFQVTTGDTEGLVNYALSVKGIRLAALIIDRTELIKLSLRSIGDVPCNEIARKHFNGGGHFNAAGGSSEGDLQSVVHKFKSILPEYNEILIK